MRRLFNEDPKLDADFYTKGVYENAIHHSQNKRTSRLYLTAGLVNWLLMVEPNLKTLTDLGCGDGGLLRLLSGNHLQMKGIDLSKANIDYAKQHNLSGQIVFEYKDFTKLKEIKSDIIVMTETIEHLLNPKQTLSTLDARYLIISTPMNEDENLHSEQHLWAWTEDEFRTMVKKYGYNSLQQIRVNNRTQLWVLEK